MKSIAKWTLRGLVLIIILLLSGFSWLYFSTKTIEQGELSVKGLQGPVTVTRDQYGVPHILAQSSDLDAFFALGFVHAQDRLWQMEVQRRQVKGSLSEIFGKKTLKIDKFLRTLGFYHAAKSSWPKFDAKSQATLQAYTRGVNAFIDRGKLPIEFKILGFKPAPWTVVDSYAWQKMMAWDMQNNWKRKVRNAAIAKKYGRQEINVVMPQYPKNAPTILSESDLKQTKPQHNVSQKQILPQNQTLLSLQHTVRAAQEVRHQLGIDDLPGKGSNSWVVSGKFTYSGKPILANDPAQFAVLVLKDVIILLTFNINGIIALPTANLTVSICILNSFIALICSSCSLNNFLSASLICLLPLI